MFFCLYFFRAIGKCKLSKVDFVEISQTSNILKSFYIILYNFQEELEVNH